MPAYDEYEDIVTIFNFTNSMALPNDYITPLNGIYTFSYNFFD